jgi:hypothetical protein
MADDRSEPLIACVSCRALVPVVDVPRHRYMTGSPGCWLVYGDVIAHEYSNAVLGRWHQLTVDAYAVQHPGGQDRVARQSVAIHLMSLCAILEHGASVADAPRRLHGWAKQRRAFEWLEPPSSLGAVTVADARAAIAGNPERYAATVRRWADAAWKAWEPHHGRVRAWLELASAARALGRAG